MFSVSFLTACESDQLMESEEVTVAPQQADARFIDGQEVVPNEVLIQFKEGTSESAKELVLARVHGKAKEKLNSKAIERLGKKEALTLVEVSGAAADAINKLKHESVEFVEPNYVYHHQATTTEPFFTNGQLWGLYGDLTSPKNVYGSQAGEAWAKNHTGSTSVAIGIIDEGVQTTHPDLQGQIWVNPFDPKDGRDNDGNGYIDDVNGWDFDANNNSVYDGGTTGGQDDHGTHVAGTIGAKNNNSGVVGINWNVKMIVCKFLGPNGGSTAKAVKALDYLTDLKNRHGINIVASNNSWGGGGYSQALYDAIKRANAKNILFIAAAGNGGSDGRGDNNDVVANYPSNFNLPNVIAVAAITSSGGRATFSNYGAKTVHIGAPGQSIYSTTAYNSYSNYSGTSMATPHVTGAAALYAASHPGSTAAAIKNAILSSATPTSSLTGKVVTGGRLNMSNF
ncbi:peptidase S8 [Rufibacter latericius]|uniref:Peptidase S8 n=2 Tax=Rufibacter latericius TaxID=2487040 RepID=A0A3M9MLQ1_9BACT|nr:peptidase S8 [Rufibacter latericius]